MQLTKREMAAFSKMVAIAADRFGNHGCNDLEPEVESALTPQEWEAFLDRYDEYGEFVMDWMILDAVSAFMDSLAKDASE